MSPISGHTVKHGSSYLIQTPLLYHFTDKDTGFLAQGHTAGGEAQPRLESEAEAVTLIFPMRNSVTVLRPGWMLLMLENGTYTQGLA